jgi:hypothetical protein
VVSFAGRESLLGYGIFLRYRWEGYLVREQFHERGRIGCGLDVAREF